MVINPYMSELYSQQKYDDPHHYLFQLSGKYPSSSLPKALKINHEKYII